MNLSTPTTNTHIPAANWRQEVRVVTHQEALELVRTIKCNPIYKTLQRNIKPGRVESYADFMRRGVFADDSIIELCELDGVMLATNGLQRLTAQTVSECDVRYVISIGQAENIIQVRNRYLIHDKNTVRTNSDDASALSIPQNISKDVYSAIIAACKSLMNHAGKQHGSRAISDTDKEQAINDWKDVAEILESFNQHPMCNRRVFKRMLATAVLPAIMVQLRWGRDAADWWKSVCIVDNNESLDDHAKKIRWYLSDGIAHIRGHNNEIIMENVCRCYNHFLLGTKTDYNLAREKNKNSSYVLRVVGTRFGEGSKIKPNELYYDSVKRGDYVTKGYATTTGCFRGYNPAWDDNNHKATSKMIKEKIINQVSQIAVVSTPLVSQGSVIEDVDSSRMVVA